MKWFLGLGFGAAALLVFVVGVGFAGDTEKDAHSVGQALKQGDYGVTLRYRFESVSDDTPAVAAKDGNASTLRSTLFYRSARYNGFGVFFEFEDVADLGLDDQHNNAGAGSLSNGVTDRPGIADPDSTEVGQAYLRYTGLEDTTISVGRQELKLGNQRFVGPVGWRQNHQSFDALQVAIQSISRTNLTYAYLNNVNRIFGDNKKLEGHLIDAEIKLGGAARITPYLYVLDYQAAADAGLSTSTLGARWQDKRSVRGGWTLPYLVEWARQSDTGDNPAEVDAGYLHLELSGLKRNLLLKAGYESLEGSAADGRFSTPLATLHAFNGWADKFLNTPATGLEDLYFAVGGKKRDLTAMLVYHDFKSDSGGLDYGTEIDAQVTYESSWKQSFGLKIARYDADGFSADTEKLWIWTGYSF